MSTKKGIASRALVFLKETQKELKKASWPTRQEAMRLTGIVIFVSLIVAVFIGLLDLSFTKLMELVIR